MLFPANLLVSTEQTKSKSEEATTKIYNKLWLIDNGLILKRKDSKEVNKYRK